MKKIVKLTALSFLIGVAALNLVLVAKTDNPFDLTLSDLKWSAALAACETVTKTSTSGPYSCVVAATTSKEWVPYWDNDRVCKYCEGRYYESSNGSNECTLTVTWEEEECD